MFYIYILKSAKNGSHYVGSCEDLGIRLEKHNAGLVASTKRYIPWVLIYFEEKHSLKEARKREGQIKSWKKRAAIEKLIEHFKI